MSDTKIHKARRDQIRTLADNASPLPYYATHNPDAMSHVVHSEHVSTGSIGSGMKGSDAAFVAVACTNVLPILDALEAEEAKVSALTARAEADNARFAAQLAALTGEQEDCQLHPCPYSREGLNCGVISLANNRSYGAWTLVFSLRKLVAAMVEKEKAVQNLARWTRLSEQNADWTNPKYGPDTIRHKLNAARKRLKAAREAEAVARSAVAGA